MPVQKAQAQKLDLVPLEPHMSHVSHPFLDVEGILFFLSSVHAYKYQNVSFDSTVLWMETKQRT